MNSSLLNEESFDFEDFELGVEEISYILNKKDVNCIRELGGVEGIARKLRVDPKVGLLDKSDFKHRIATYGTNEVSPPRRTSFFRLVLRALNDLTLQILLGVAVVSLVISLAIPKEMHSGDEGGDDWIEGASILLTVSVVTLVTAVNEYQRDKQFERLDKVKYNFKVKVRRNGIEEMLETFKIVVGDVVLLEAGDQAPGDGLYIGGCNLSMDESSMTGENEPVKKDEERCFLMSGTHVADGIGEMLVLATGENSEYGKMMRSLKVKNTPTPLQRRLDNLAKLVGKIGTAAALATFLALMIRWVIRVVPVPWKWAYLLDWVKYFVISITIVVVAIPEGLSLAVTITLAYSMKYMLRDQILVRRLASCETMGGATSICSDKTGTLTENRMTVLKGWIAGGIFEDTSAVELSDAVVQILGEGISVNSKASVNFESASHEMVGSRTECALISFIYALGMDYRSYRSSNPLIKLYPFSSETKRMAAIVQQSGSAYHRLHCKGAPELILPSCSKMLVHDGSSRPVNSETLAQLEDFLLSMTRHSLRTIAIAYKDGLQIAEWDLNSKDLTLVALFGIADPIRSSVPDAVQSCKNAGIVVRMVTGDSSDTARSIAQQCNIWTSQCTLLDGPTFRSMPDEQLDSILPKLRVLSRAQPLDKLRLVQRLQLQGEIVAVTGDGTNDAPALKQSDIGLAMGIMGTETAKHASDIIIMDDNFVSIVRSVLWGRCVYGNIRKFLQFQLTVNFTALLIAFIGALTDRNTPLRSSQLLWINFIMDTLAALAFSSEKPSPFLLHQKPYGRHSPIISPLMWRNLIGHCLFQTTLLLFILYLGPKIWGIPDGMLFSGASVHYTILFNVFVYLQLFNLINARCIFPNQYNPFSGILSNWPFLIIILSSFVVQALLVEFCGQFLFTTHLSALQWIMCILLGSTSLIFGGFLRLIPTPLERYERPHFL